MLPPPAVRGIYRTDSRARAAYAEHSTSLIPRGAGSAMGGGNVGEGVIADLGQMAGRRLEIDATGRRAITSASVTLAELNAAAAPYGLRLPPDPSSGQWASLGGMVATNAAGARSVRYGSVRAWVEALTIVTADSEVVQLHRGKTEHRSQALGRFNQDAAPAIASAAPLVAARFPRTRKNSSGYALDAYLASGDVLDLFIGSEGTLGFVTEIEWRLDPRPACRAGLRVSLRSLEELGPAVAALSSAEPSAVELLDRSFLDLVGSRALSEASLHDHDAAAVLLVELERDDDELLTKAVERAASAVRPLALSIESGISQEAADRLWEIRHAASPILASLPERQRSLQVIEDGCVPVSRMGEYIQAVRRAAAESGTPAVVFGHAGDGHVHVNLLPDVGRLGWEAAITRVFETITETVLRLGGTLSGEHGDGRLRASALVRVYGPEIVELFRRIKQCFDPLGILNPGIILPSGDPPLSRLKVGAHAVPLPDDLQHALREIERAGGYGRCRLELAEEEGLGSRV
jgi:FAD/FMN-containing dehydrogenase